MKSTLLLLSLLFSASVFADQYVKGYTKKDGTYVQPHHRSAPDGNPYNNYSTQGNVNPYTGKEGHVNPYQQQQVQPIQPIQPLQPYSYSR